MKFSNVAKNSCPNSDPIIYNIEHNPRNILEKRLTALAVPIVTLLPDTRCVINMHDTMLFLLGKMLVVENTL